jgi:putative Mg2+ transporter-C (MgtC) family protein
MPIDISWVDITWRLVVAVLAGGIIGYDRGDAGRPAGVRTTILVCVAATAAMILANLLLPTDGKHSDGFAVLDPMRLPLGILTGVGFIGAGAIMHRGNFVQGLTTAATLWYSTVLGLCVGAGEFMLGAALVVIAILVLWGLKRIEGNCRRAHVAKLEVTCVDERLTADELVAVLKKSEVKIRRLGFEEAGTFTKFRCEVEWKDSSEAPPLPGWVQSLAAQHSVTFQPTR